jgi:hypothetical protein
VVETASQFTEAITGLLNDEEARLKLEAPEPCKLEGYSWARSAEAQMTVYRRLTGGRSAWNG